MIKRRNLLQHKISNWSLANFIATTGRDQYYTNVLYTSEIKKRQSPISNIDFCYSAPSGRPAGVGDEESPPYKARTDASGEKQPSA
jgi:hypothetical protein